MIENLKIAIIQTELFWEEKSKNLATLEGHLFPIKEELDLIVLPEMFSTGFSMEAEKLAEDMKGATVDWMSIMARFKQATIVGSLIIKENGQYFNRLICAHQNGEVEHYDKRHLFRLAGEDKIFTAGKKQKTINIKGWNIRLSVCYDLRFPVWSRNTNGYDILLNVANWPVPRIKAWRALNIARAIENQCYVLACNRVGKDQKGNDYSGHSTIIDFQGATIDERINDQGVLFAELNKQSLEKFKEKLPFYLDKDTFEINN